ncbi:MAG: hypothetical protein IPG99_11985 [Ignavibacteria bacterium]|nr:hypothetical protein [Ignavibacteria bacterium]
MSDGAGALSDMVILKYDSVGSLIWNTRYSSASNGFDKPNKMSIDNYGSVLISGTVTGAGTGMDFAVLKYCSSQPLAALQNYLRPVFLLRIT